MSYQNPNDPLNNTMDTFPKICEILDGFGAEYSIHKDPEDYPYLGEYDVCIGVSNPTGGETLYIALQNGFCGEFILGFGKWHTHYLGYLYGYENISGDIRKILSGETAVMSVSIKSGWEILELINKGDCLEEKFNGLHGQYREKLEELGGTVKTFWWDTSKNACFNVRNGGNDLWIIM
ncbi:MAG: hypothetical protein NC395_04640 [Prevotella sp.]|nr:hypothetical protein [Prevotella sp.]